MKKILSTLFLTSISLAMAKGLLANKHIIESNKLSASSPIYLGVVSKLLFCYYPEKKFAFVVKDDSSSNVIENYQIKYSSKVNAGVIVSYELKNKDGLTLIKIKKEGNVYNIYTSPGVVLIEEGYYTLYPIGSADKVKKYLDNLKNYGTAKNALTSLKEEIGVLKDNLEGWEKITSGILEAFDDKKIKGLYDDIEDLYNQFKKDRKNSSKLTRHEIVILDEAFKIKLNSLIYLNNVENLYESIENNIRQLQISKEEIEKSMNKVFSLYTQGNAVFDLGNAKEKLNILKNVMLKLPSLYEEILFSSKEIKNKVQTYKRYINKIKYTDLEKIDKVFSKVSEIQKCVENNKNKFKELDENLNYLKKVANEIYEEISRKEENIPDFATYKENLMKTLNLKQSACVPVKIIVKGGSISMPKGLFIYPVYYLK